MVRGLPKRGVNPESSGLWHQVWGRWVALGGTGSRGDMVAPWLRLLGSAALTTVWSLASTAKIYRGFKGLEVLRSALGPGQGSRAHSGSGCNWWCAQAQLRGQLATGTLVVAGEVPDTHVGWMPV